MEEYIDSIRKSLDEKNFHAALFIALSIPDICGKLETPNVRKNGERAKRWFSENLGRKYCANNNFEVILGIDSVHAHSLPDIVKQELKKIPNNARLTPELFWQLRCAFLHEASDLAGDTKIHLTHSTSRIGFVNGDIVLSAVEFCNDMCLAANEWLEKMKSDNETWERIMSRAKIKNSILNGLIEFD